MRLLAVHQIDIPKRSSGVLFEIARMNNAGDAVSQQIDDVDVRSIRNVRKRIDLEREWIEAVPTAIHPA